MLEPSSQLEPSPESAAAALQSGGVALLPTDTVYGLIAHPSHASAIARIFTLKRRPAALRLQVLTPSPTSLANLGAIVPQAAQALLASDEIRGAVTFIFALDAKHRPNWLVERVEIGVRFPGDPRIQAVLNQTGPLFATSANAHGQTPGQTVPEILGQLDGAPDYVWDAGRLTGANSTVVNFNAAPPRIERWGAASDLSVFGLGHA